MHFSTSIKVVLMIFRLLASFLLYLPEQAHCLWTLRGILCQNRNQQTSFQSLSYHHQMHQDHLCKAQNTL